jgi:uncharacterized protein (DUF342 family)
MSPQNQNQNPEENPDPERRQNDTHDAVRGEEAPETDSETAIQIPVPPFIRFFRKGESDQLLAAAVEPSQDAPSGIPLSHIREWIRSQDCEGWLVREETILQLSRDVRRLKQAKEYIVAERKDCQAEVQISQDRLKAWIRVSPAFGGNPLTETWLRQELEKHKISFGLKKDVIQEILRDGECERKLIAEGIPPVPGEKAQFIQLVVESENKGIPQERENGSVDYKNLGLFLSVDKGIPLLKRIPPTMGTAGTRIDGSVIPAALGADRALISGPGTAVSEQDPDLIVATRAGQPSFMDNSARVDPTLEIDSVNPSTGNVVFDGNIIVRGPVEAGFTVTAGQDLTILDTVEGANLTAGKNMVLLTGIYGKHKAKISVEGNLEARFLNDCTVRCGGNIEVADLVAHCTVNCEGSVFLGKYGGKGQFFGGKLVASREVRAEILGSASEATTLVEIAPPKALIPRQTKVEEDIAKTQKELDAVESKLQTMKESSEGNKQAKFGEQATALARKLEELKMEQDAIHEKLEAAQKGKIRASQVYRGVMLRIGKHRQTINERTSDLFFFPPPEEKKHPQRDR